MLKVYVIGIMPLENQDYTFARELEEIKQLSPDKILILYDSEFPPTSATVEFYQELFRYLEETNKTATCVVPTIGTLDQWFNPRILFDINPASCIIRYEHWIKTLKETYDIDYGNSEKLFSCYNHNPYYIRAYLVDQLFANDLANDGIITFHKKVPMIPNKFREQYQWKYHDGSQLTDEPNFFLNNFPILTNEAKASEKEFSCYLNIPKSYNQCFIDVVTESINEKNFIRLEPNLDPKFDTEREYGEKEFFMTEKTLRPLAMGKPFMSLCARRFHYEYLQDYLGMQLYDEVIDYSFDLKTDVSDRIQGIIDNLKKIKAFGNFSELNKRIKDKLDFNRNRLIEISNSIDFSMPDSCKFMIESFDYQLFGNTCIHRNPVLRLIERANNR